MSLSSPAVSEIEIEGSSLRLFNEFLGLYFDGHVHNVGGNLDVPFPKATIKFQQSSQPQPLDGLGITMVWVRPARTIYRWDVVGGVRQQRALAQCAWMFWIRAQLAAGSSGNAKALVQTAGDRLFALLQNSAETQLLAQKGVHKLRPETPQLVADGSGAKPGDTAFVIRMLTCSGLVRYPVMSQVRAQP